MMITKRIAEYFAVSGVDYLKAPVSNIESLEPITSLVVIFPGQGETCPDGYTCISLTPSGLPANLNFGSRKAPACYLCYKRGRGRAPIVSIDIIYEGKDSVPEGLNVIKHSLTGLLANVNNTNNFNIYVAYQRAKSNDYKSLLAVVDMSIIVPSKGERAPNSFYTVNKSLNTGFIGSDVYVCYRKSVIRPTALFYQPSLLSRYPFHDHVEFPLPASVPVFCLPFGAVVDFFHESTTIADPQLTTFSMTDGQGDKVYVTSISFFERLPDHSLSTELEQKLAEMKEKSGKPLAVFGSKAVSLLSRWPLFKAFYKFLLFLYRIAVTEGHNTPLEWYVAHFMHNVPPPSAEQPRIHVMLAHETIKIHQQYSSRLGSTGGASFVMMLKVLGVQNLVTLLCCVLLEHKILIHSLKQSLLALASETVSAMTFPFVWQCPYIPMCPLMLVDVITAPIPFICGISSLYFDSSKAPDDVTCVDLDLGEVIMYRNTNDPRNNPVNHLEKISGKLRDQLQNISARISEEVPVKWTEFGANEWVTVSSQVQSFELEIQEAFIRFLAGLMKGYRNYLIPMTGVTEFNISSLFSMEGFFQSRPSSHQKFFSQLMNTQLFSRFIESRSLHTNRDLQLAFFDECCDRLESKEPLLHLERKSKDQPTVFIMPPDYSHLPRKSSYSYECFPVLDKEVFPPECFAEQEEKTSDSLTLQEIMTRTVEEKASGFPNKSKVPNDVTWSRLLLGQCYAAWFCYLPSLMESEGHPLETLRRAFSVITDFLDKRISLPDRVCFRILMSLFYKYKQPGLAVKLYLDLERRNMTLDAVTYCLYNKVIIENHWLKRRWKIAVWVVVAAHKFSAGRGVDPSSVHLSEECSESIDGPPSDSLPLEYPKSYRINEDKAQSISEGSLANSNSSLPSSVATELPHTAFFRSRSSLVPTLSGGSSPYLSERLCSNDTSLRVVMTSCHQCIRCGFHIYDEEIMAGWSENDSELKFVCPICSEGQVPSLSLSIQVVPVSQSIPRITETHQGHALSILEITGTSSTHVQSTSGTGETPSAHANSDTYLGPPKLSFSSLRQSIRSRFQRSGSVRHEVPRNFSNLSNLLPKTPSSQSLTDSLSRLSISPRDSNAGRGDQTDIAHILGLRVDKNQSSISSLADSVRSSAFVSSTNDLTSPQDHADFKSTHISFPYLSPFVLRKEMENLLQKYGELVFNDREEVEQRLIVYWNMVWYFQRLRLAHNLPSFLQDSLCTALGLDQDAKPSLVLIKLSWDMDRPNEQYLPLYRVWENAALDEPTSVLNELRLDTRLNQVVKWIQDDDLFSPVSSIRELKRSLAAVGSSKWSIYRELLFLALAAHGNNIDLPMFDLEYRTVTKMHPDLDRSDRPPSERSVACRAKFGTLPLLFLKRICH